MRYKINLHKRFISFFLAVAMTISLIPSITASEKAITFHTTSGDTLTREMVSDQLEAAGVGASDTFSAAFDSSVIAIGSSAFSGCTGLTSVIIPEGVVYIGSYAFRECTNITEIVIPNGVTTIRNQTFSDCTSLKRVFIPKSVVSIGAHAFWFCSSLTNVYFEGNAPAQVDEGGFNTPYAVAYVYQEASGFPPEGEIWNGLTIRYRTEGRDLLELLFELINAAEDILKNDQGKYTSESLDYLESVLQDIKDALDTEINKDNAEEYLNYLRDAIDSLIEIEICKHDFRFVETVEPTCVTEGYTSYICSICSIDDIRDVTPIDPDAHDWGLWTEIITPTCVDKGEETRECKNDPSHTQTRDIDERGHTWVKGDTIEPTYTAKGYTLYECSECGEEKQDDWVDELQLTTISAAPITGVASPTANAVPSASINDGTGFTSLLTWNGDPVVFINDTVYTATITLTAGEGFTFGGGFSDTSQIAGFTVNGNTPVWVSNSGNQLVFTVTFPKTGPAVDKGVITFRATSGNTLTQTMVNDQIGAAKVGINDTFSAAFDSSVRSIGDNAFLGRTGLTGAVIPNSVASIGGCAFSGTSIQTIRLPASVNSFGLDESSKGPFASAPILKNIVFETGTANIANNVFVGITESVSVFIPRSVKSIGSGSGLSSNMTMYVFENTFTHTYAKNNSINYKIMPTIVYSGEIPIAYQYLPYSYTFTSNDGTWIDIEPVGSLPNGLTIKWGEKRNEGELWGAPLIAGTFNVTVRTTDKTYPLKDEITFEIRIVAEQSSGWLQELEKDKDFIDKAKPFGDYLNAENIYVVEISEVNPENKEMKILYDYSDFVDLWIDGVRKDRDIDYSVRDGSTVVTVYGQTTKRVSSDKSKHVIAAEFKTKDGPKKVSQNFEVVTKTTTAPAASTRRVTSKPPVLPSISMTSATFDKYGGSDITLTLNFDSYRLYSLKNGNQTLVYNRDYSINNSAITLNASYLKTLALGKQVISFVMSGGANPALNLEIKDSTPPPQPPKHNFDDNGNVYDKDSGKNLVHIIQKDSSLFSSAKVDGRIISRDTQFSVGGNPVRITLYAAYLNSLGYGSHSLDVQFSDGIVVTASFSVVGTDRPWVDVADGDWYLNDILWAYREKIMLGVSKTEFLPLGSSTTAMVSVTLAKILNPDLDLDAGSEWYSAAFNWANNNHFFDGIGNPTPFMSLDRGQLAIIIVNSLSYAGIEFDDPDESIIFTDMDKMTDEEQKAFRLLNAKQIIAGRGGGIADPRSKATRAELAVILRKIVENLL